MRGAQTLGDALRASLASDNGNLSEAPAPVLFQAGLAAEQMERRALIHGMSEVMAKRAVDRGFAMVAAAEGWCETPIEKRLLPWLVFADYGDEFLSVPAGVHSPRHQDEMPGDDILIIPQFAFAKYRMDFAIMTRHGDQTRFVCVECDGDGFHAVAYDSRRDAYLRGFGIPTVRMSGKEIAAHPGGAVARVVEAVRSVVEG